MIVIIHFYVPSIVSLLLPEPLCSVIYISALTADKDKGLCVYDRWNVTRN